MKPVLYKILGILAVVATVALVLMWGIRQYGNSRVAQGELSTVQEAVQSAVVARSEAGKVDAQTAAQKRTAVDSGRMLGNTARAELRRIQDETIQKCAECAVRDNNTVFVLNNLIRESNRVIDGSR